MPVGELSYSSRYHAAEEQVDELLIANMISVINNPNLAKMLDDQELKTILSVIKNHVVLKSEIALNKQNRYLDNNDRSR